MRLESRKCVKNAFAAGAPPRTPLGELTALPGPPSWIWGRGREDRERAREGNGKERGEGKGKGGKGEGKVTLEQKFWLRPCYVIMLASFPKVPKT